MNSGFKCPSWQSSPDSSNAVHLQITNSLTVEYTGSGHADSDAASVRTNIAVPAACGLFYYEVTIDDKGREGFIGLGFCVADILADRLPGWELGSWGYHGDDGNAFGGTGKGFAFGPRFTTGDVIGALWNRMCGQISFFKNGVSLGIAFEGVQTEKLYPTVGLRSTGERVTANFGDTPWRTDMKVVQAAIKQQLEDEIASIPLQKPRQSILIMEELIFSHLQHSGYADTARIAAVAMFGGKRCVSEEDAAGARQRRNISTAITSGQVTEALEAAEAVAPGMWTANQPLLFRMHVQAYLEHVRAKRDTEALDYGRNTLSHVASSRADHSLLQDASTLLGYEKPSTCPEGHLLSDAHKAALAEDVNRAVLSHQGCQEKSPLERIIRQGVVVSEELKKHNHPVASMLKKK